MKRIGKIVRRAISMLRFWRFWNLGAFCWIFDSKGRLLLVETIDGHWGLPGGEVNPRKDGVEPRYPPKFLRWFPFSTLERELREELGIGLIGIDPRSIQLYPIFPRLRWPGDIAICALVTSTEEPSKTDWDIKSYRFFSKTELAALSLGPRMRAMVGDGFIYHEQGGWF